MTDTESTFEDAGVADQKAESDATERASTLDQGELFRRLKRWFKQDKRHSDDWRKDAEEEFDFVAGRQWSTEDMAVLRDQMRPAVAFNRVAPVISAVSGTEVTNRQEVRYLPREPGDAQADEVMSSAAQWFRDECNAEDEESDSFWDTLVCGMGWTETRMNFETDRDGAPMLERVDPLEMFWDCNSRRRCVEDGRRVFRVKRVSVDEAMALVGAEVEEEDLDADWANFSASADKDETAQEARLYRPSENGSKDDSDDDLITLVECQWWEREPVHAIAGEDGQTQFLTGEEFGTLESRTAEMGGEMPDSVPQTRRKYYRAWLGKKVLAEPEEAPYGDHFSYQAMTGYRDRNRGTFYGLVRGMKEPQQWANKWLSQTMHILNTNAKGGGMMVEDGAFKDEREAEESWARPDKHTYMTRGALSNATGPKIQAKPQGVMPQGLSELMAFALQSIRDASGVNLELMGMKEQEQAGVLEAQRKKQAMAVLAVLFDGLRRYRKNQGKLQLYLIQNFVSDGRLIRILGKNGQEQYIPLIKMPGFSEYDVIVDDAPSSPQQKDVVWGLMTQMLPVIKDQMSPELYSVMLDYSPLPSSAISKFKESIKEAQARTAPIQQEQQAIAKAGAVAKVNETQSKAELNRAKAGKEIHDVMNPAPSDMNVGGASGGIGQPAHMQPALPAPSSNAPNIGGVQGNQLVRILTENANQTKMLAQQVAANTRSLAESLNKPKRVVRDVDGSIMGVE